MEYTLFYWDAPFRGNFVQLLLEDAEVPYQKKSPEEIYPDQRLAIDAPGMAPPYLYHHKTKKYLCQMPAIMMKLGNLYDYLPEEAWLQALIHKLILDCNDILMEITNYNGSRMWDRESWQDFREDRLVLWMEIFEKTATSHGLKENSGFLIGEKISVADLATSALWGTMVRCLPPLKEDLQKRAPAINHLCERIERRKNIQKFLETQQEDIGLIYCGGQIEASLREMLEESSA